MNKTGFKEFEQVARRLCKDSGTIIREYFRKPYGIDLKEDESPVTIADKKAEERMREILMREFPSHGIIGEEFGDYQIDAEFVWVLDPIDGTKNYICGGHAFGTLIALLRNGDPILGVIHQPILGEFLMGDGSHATFNGVETKVRDCSTIADAILLTSDPYMIKEYQDEQRFEALREKVQVYRGWGDCYGYFLLATGNVDIMVDPIMNKWDIMALIPIIRGAGGCISDYHGNDPVVGSSIIATSAKIHREVISLLTVA